MRKIPTAIVTGTVQSVSDKPISEKNKKSHRLVKLSQINADGDAEVIDIKVFNGMKVEAGKVQSINCELFAWAMKGDHGDILFGLSAKAIEPAK